MDGTPIWVGSISAIGAIIAAVTGTAVYWRGRPGVSWALRETGHAAHVVNVDRGTAKDVHVRVGSASDPSDVMSQAHLDRVGPGEHIPVMLAITYRAPVDTSVVVTWRRLGRNRTWTYRLMP